MKEKNKSLERRRAEVCMKESGCLFDDCTFSQWRSLIRVVTRQGWDKVEEVRRGWDKEIMVHANGMWIGIERDGYAHS